MLRRLALLALLAVLAVACGPASSTSIATQGLRPQADGWRGLPFEQPTRLPTVVLHDTAGREVRLPDDLLGTPTLLFFGYASCPDICPVHLAAIAAGMEAASIGYDQLDVVFVSVDPERDTPERIDAFLANFSPRMIGLHGDLEAVGDALGQLALSGPVVEGVDPRGEGDLIGHPAQVLGFDHEGRGMRQWPFGARRSDWLADLPRIVSEWS